METTIMGYIGTTMKSIPSFLANQGPAQTNLNTEPGGTCRGCYAAILGGSWIVVSRVTIVGQHIRLCPIFLHLGVVALQYTIVYLE